MCLLDAVLHLAASTVELIVERGGLALEIGDDVTGVLALVGVFQSCNHAPLGVPGVRAIAKLGERALLGLGGGELHCQTLLVPLGQGVKPRVPRESDAVTHAVALAPAQHAVAAEAGVGAHDDAHRGPSLA